MNKDTLTAAVETCKTETRDALQLVYNELNHGQQQKILKDPAVEALFQRYGVEV